MKRNCNKDGFKILAIFLMVIVFMYLAPSLYAADSAIENENGSVVIENNYFKYEIASDGRNLHFIDKVTGIDYLNNTTVSYCAYVTQDGKENPVSSASVNGNLLKLEFKNSNLTANI